jgi:hypothetical protein
MNDSAFDTLPDSALAFNTGSGVCVGFSARPFLPNTTNSRVCAFQTSNRTRMESCCSEPVEQWECWSYCSYSGELRDFANCLSVSSEAYCEGETVGNITEKLRSESFGYRQYSAPKTSWMLLGLLFVLLFAGHADALIVPSLDPNGSSGVARRQSDNSSCTFEVVQRSTKPGRQVTISDRMNCPASSSGLGVSFCPLSFDIDTGIFNNNRTINDTSSAGPEYDQFFDVVSEAVGGRMFPALSSVTARRDMMISPGDFVLTFVPYLVSSTRTGACVVCV